MRIDQIAIPFPSANEQCPPKEGMDIECGAGSQFGSLIERLQEHVEAQPQRQCTQSSGEGASNGACESGMVKRSAFSDTALTLSADAAAAILEQTPSSDGSGLPIIASELFAPGFHGAEGTSPLPSSTSAAECTAALDMKTLHIESTVFVETAVLTTTIVAGGSADAAAAPAPACTRPIKSSACLVGRQEKGAELQILSSLDPLMAIAPASPAPSSPPQNLVVQEIATEGNSADSPSTGSMCPEPILKNGAPAVAQQASSAVTPASPDATPGKSSLLPATSVGIPPLLGEEMAENPSMLLPTPAANPGDRVAEGPPSQSNSTQSPQLAGLPASLSVPAQASPVQRPMPALVIEQANISAVFPPVPAQASPVQRPMPALVIEQANISAVFPRLPVPLSRAAGTPNISNGLGSGELPNFGFASEALSGTEKGSLRSADSESVFESAARSMLIEVVKSAPENAEGLPETKADVVSLNFSGKASLLSTSVEAATLVSPGIPASPQGVGQTQSVCDPVAEPADPEVGKTTWATPAKPDSSVVKEALSKLAPQDAPVSVAVPAREKGSESPYPKVPQSSETRPLPLAADQAEEARIIDHPQAITQEEDASPQVQVPSRNKANGSCAANDLPQQVEVPKGLIITGSQPIKDPLRASVGNARASGTGNGEHPPVLSGGLPGSNMVSETKRPDMPRAGIAAPPNTSSEFLQQLADRIQMNLQNGGAALRIRLRPENLGHIEIRAENAISGIIARIVTESGDVKNYLENNLQSLQQTLQNQGLKVERIEIVVQDGFDTRHSAQSDTAGHHGANQHGGRTLTSSDASVSRHGQSAEELVFDASAIRVLGPNSTFHTIA
jgi:flagellar hook-length control protein FliK